MGFSAGSTTNSPLFFSRLMPSWKEYLAKISVDALTWFLLTAVVVTLVSEQMGNKGGGLGGAANKAMGMSDSIVKEAENPNTSFDDVAGVDEAKADLEEIVQYLKDPSKFTRLGGKLPKGVLLTGPPGTGKTLLARAIAGEAGVPFFHTSGSEFEEMYVGVGAKRVRELFEAANSKSTPCIIFIDEIDAIGGKRQTKDQSAMKMTLNQLLVEMDGFKQNDGVVVIGATNLPDSLDTALLRPGRFDKQVDVALPDIGGREAIINLYAKKVPLDSDVSAKQLARGTPGFSGAELANMINQAALKASMDGLQKVGMGTLEWAKDKIMMGAERKSAIISPNTVKCTAFHEAGHALVALKTEGADPIHKATIMPRGQALGMVMQLPDGDQTSMSRKEMLARLDVCMGGRIAEELVFGKNNLTSGASNDIKQATQLAKAMVSKWGLSEKVGVVFYDDKSKASGMSQNQIDEEVQKLTAASYKRATAVLERYRKDLEVLAKGLIDYESLSGGELVDLLEGRAINMDQRSQRPSRVMKDILPARRPSSSSSSSSGSSSGSGSEGI